MSFETKIYLLNAALILLTAVQSAVAYSKPTPLTLLGLVWVGGITIFTAINTWRSL